MERLLIKHQKYGILVRLPDGIPFGDVYALVRETFTKDRKFFEGSELTLSFRGRSLTSDEEDALTDCIETCGGIRVLCVFSESPETSELFLKVRRAYEADLLPKKPEPEEKSAPEAPKPRPNVGEYMTIPGNLKNGDVYKTRENILILGDVEEHAVIVSERNIVVLGTLAGIARAGEDRESGSYFIASADLAARKLFIRGIAAPPVPKKGILAKNRKNPGFAFLKDGNAKVELSHLTEAELSRLYDASELNLRKKENA